MNASTLTDLAFKRDQLTDMSRKTLANELFVLLQGQGCKGTDIINLSTELLDLVIGEMKDDEKRAS